MEKRARKKSIKFKMVALPLMLIFVGVSIIGGISSYFARENLLNEMRANGFYLAEGYASRLKDNSETLKTIDRLIEERIETANRVIAFNSGNINNEFLSALSRDMNIVEINVTSPDGEIIYSNMPENIGWTFPADHIGREVLNGSKTTLYEDIRQSSVDGNFYKYGYLGLPTGNMIQSGIDASSIATVMESFEYQVLIDEISQLEKIVFALYIDDNFTAAAHSNKERIGIDLKDDPGAIAAISRGEKYSNEYDYGAEGVRVYEVLVPVEEEGRVVGAINLGYSMENINTAVRNNMMMVFGISLLVFLVMGILMYLISNDIVKLIQKLKTQMNLMGEGDFSQEIPKDILAKEDELGEIAYAVKEMQESMRAIVSGVVETSNQLAASSQELTATAQQSATASDEVARTIEQIAQGASDQARDTEKGAVSITDLGNIVEENERHINRLNKSTENVNKLKDEGFGILNGLVEQTNKNNQSSREVKEVIVTTNESAEKIVTASEMIKNISNQTNLLALNAAIEAARAGEAGRGFSVVADEIRKLAEESNRFTEEISTVISELTGKTSNAVKTMEELEGIVNSQSKSVEMTSAKFEGISEAIEDMKSAISMVNESEKEMSAKKDEIISIIENLSAISEENAAGTEEASASVEEQSASMAEIANSSEDLAKIAQNLNEMISKFKI